MILLQSDFLILDLLVIDTMKNTNTSIKVSIHWFTLGRWICLETQYLKLLRFWFFYLSKKYHKVQNADNSWKGTWESSGNDHSRPPTLQFPVKHNKAMSESGAPWASLGTKAGQPHLGTSIIASTSQLWPLCSSGKNKRKIEFPQKGYMALHGNWSSDRLGIDLLSYFRS